MNSYIRFHLSVIRDKKKDLASNCAVYSPFGVDVYFRQQKINHIARYVQLPIVNSLGKLPPLLVVNVQVHIQYSNWQLFSY